jgi:hypothetical protein
LKGEVASLQRQGEGLRAQIEKRDRDLRSLSDSFEAQRREFMAHAAKNSERARNAEREALLLRVAVEDERSKTRGELQALRPILPLAARFVSEQLNLLHDSAKKPTDQSDEAVAQYVTRNLPRLAHGIEQLQQRVKQAQERRTKDEALVGELRSTIGLERTLHERERVDSAALYKLELQKLSDRVIAAEQRAVAAESSLLSERAAQLRRNQLLDQLLAEKREMPPPTPSASELLTVFMGTLPEVQRKVSAVMKDQKQRADLTELLARSRDAVKLYGETVSRFETEFARHAETSEVPTPLADSFEATCAELASLGSDVVRCTGNLSLVLALDPDSSRRVVEKLSPDELLVLFGIYLSNPSNSQVLAVEGFLAVAENLSPPVRAAAALIAPSTEEAALILFGGPAARSAVRELTRRFGVSGGDRSAPHSERSRRFKRSIVAENHDLPVFENARASLSAVQFVHPSLLGEIQTLFKPDGNGRSASLSVLGFDFRDLALFLPDATPEKPAP